MTWTASGMPDQSGQTVVVTGANSGLGYEITEAFARRGAEVVMACRSVDRGETARQEIEQAVPGASLAVLELDLADLSSVAAFADRFHDRYDTLDVLQNNAGVMALPRRETADGFEAQFGTNHLGHFALTGRLLPALLAAEDARVVTMSSEAHRRGELDFEDLHHEHSYGRWEAYGQSKLANLLFAYELDRRLSAADMDLVSVGVHPGWAATNLQTAGPEMEGSRAKAGMMRAANALLGQDAEQGALPALYAATMPDVRGGDYWGPGGFMNMRGYPTRQPSSDRSHDEAAARRLWDVSVELTDVEYDIPAPAVAADD